MLPSGRVLVTQTCRNIVPMDLPRYGITFPVSYTHLDVYKRQVYRLHLSNGKTYDIENYSMWCGSASKEPVSYTHLDVYKRQG